MYRAESLGMRLTKNSVSVVLYPGLHNFNVHIPERGSLGMRLVLGTYTEDSRLYKHVRLEGVFG